MTDDGGRRLYSSTVQISGQHIYLHVEFITELIPFQICTFPSTFLDDELAILDVRKFKPIHKRKFNYEVNELAWNTTGDMFFLTTGNGTVEVLAYPSLQPIDTLMAHTAGCYCIPIDPLGRYFPVGSADSLVSLLDITEMLCVRTFTKLEWPVRTISFNHTGEFIASASEDLFIDIDLEYLLQETSRDGFCFFVTSTPISKLDVDIALLVGSSGLVPVQPSGFALMLDGPDGFNSNASLISDSCHPTIT